MPAALVIGASRGLGLEFVKQYRGDGWRVHGTVRSAAHADRLRSIGALPIELDVIGADAPARLQAAMEGIAPPDVVILNAGIHGPRHIGIRQPPSAADFDLVMHTNVLGPMRLMPVLAPWLESARGTMALVTSRMGSVSAAGTPHGLLYRVSKAAENMLAKMAHIEFGAQGVRVLALHPGWVRTDMGGPNAEVEAQASIAGLRRVIADPLAYPGGAFYDFRGESLAW